MATYYKWRKSTIIWVENDSSVSSWQTHTPIRLHYSKNRPTLASDHSYVFDGYVDLTYKDAGEINLGVGNYVYIGMEGGYEVEIDGIIFAFFGPFSEGSKLTISSGGTVNFVLPQSQEEVHHVISSKVRGDQLGYVYSMSSSAYPINGESGNYWYDQRTTITSPTAPTDIRYPNPITTPTVTVSWDAATSKVPSYGVSKYELSYELNGSGAWKTVGTPGGTSLEVPIPTEATTIQFRVRAQDSNGQWSGYATGTVSNVLATPNISAPSQAMQGQNIPVSWTAVDGATGYTLQRKANTDTDWVEVYTGQDLEFTEEVGTWSTVQYRVQAVFSVGPGGWGTSKVIPVVSASALVISGQDGDLGTLTADVPYTVSTDTGKPITVERKVNGQVVASIEASSNFAYDIPIYDLPTGAGTITLTCSVTPEGQAPVQAERKWTYYKAPVLFPQTGSTAQITKEGKNIYPLTIAEAVRTPQYMGGSLDKTLELLEEILNTAVISVGTYVGTGTSGQSAPNRLRFMSPPTVVTVYGEGRVLSISNTEPTGGQTDAYIQGNEAIWYNISADKQLNESGKTYTYFAAGKRV